MQQLNKEQRKVQYKWFSLLTSFLLIYDTIAYFAKPDISGIIIGFQDNIKNKGDIFLFLLDLLLEYVWNLGIWLLIFYFSPCHYFISDYASEFFYFVMRIILF